MLFGFCSNEAFCCSLKLYCALQSLAKGLTFAGFNGKSLLKQGSKSTPKVSCRWVEKKVPRDSRLCPFFHLSRGFLRHPFF